MQFGLMLADGGFREDELTANSIGQLKQVKSILPHITK